MKRKIFLVVIKSVGARPWARVRFAAYFVLCLFGVASRHHSMSRVSSGRMCREPLRVSSRIAHYYPSKYEHSRRTMRTIKPARWINSVGVTIREYHASEVGRLSKRIFRAT